MGAGGRADGSEATARGAGDGGGGGAGTIARVLPGGEVAGARSDGVAVAECCGTGLSPGAGGVAPLRVPPCGAPPSPVLRSSSPIHTSCVASHLSVTLSRPSAALREVG
jgi:hypothetical protein